MVGSSLAPGPGNYQTSLIDKKDAPKYGFGSSERGNGKDLNGTFPGPGQYKLRDITGNDGPGASMHQKLKNMKGMLTPGPGHYESSLKNRNAAPAYGQGTQKRTNSQAYTISPPPNAYQVNTGYTSKNAAKWGFGSEKRGNTAYNTLAPGPGNYKIDSMAFDQKYKFHMGQKLEDGKDKMRVPGAGTYDPDYKSVTKAMPKYSMK
jgi:hypothetical protein